MLLLACLPVCLFDCLLACLFLCLFACLRACLFVCVSLPGRYVRLRRSQECRHNGGLLHLLGLLHPDHLPEARRWGGLLVTQCRSTLGSHFCGRRQAESILNTGVVLVVTLMSIGVALIPLPATLLWVTTSACTGGQRCFQGQLRRPTGLSKCFEVNTPAPRCLKTAP